tara:strand:- start:122 stop:1000 length:879 start_codon:yes stop_codon:yes gene_type:complete
MNYSSSIFDSTHNYSYLMGNTDNDLINNETHHIVRNIDNNINDSHSNEIKNLKHDFDLIKKELLKFMNNDTLDIEEIEEDIKIHEAKELSKEESENKEETIEEHENKEETIEELENKEEDEFNKNIDELLNNYDKFLTNYSKVQENYFYAEKELKNDINKTKTDIKMLNSSIEYAENITKDYLKNTDDTTLIDSLKSLGNIIKSNTHTYEKKKDYIKKRKEVEKYINVIEKMNLNISNTCTICMSNNVDRYFNPCGHTSCQKCINRISEYDNRLTCLICRVNVMEVRNLYFS